MNKTKAKWYLAILFSIIDLIVIGTGIWVQKENDTFKSRAVDTEAIVTKIKTNYDSNGNPYSSTYIEYSIDGEKYSGTLSAYYSSMDLGDIVHIYVDAQAPEKFKENLNNYVGYFLIVVGILFYITNIIVIFITIKNKNSEINENKKGGEQDG